MKSDEHLSVGFMIATLGKLPKDKIQTAFGTGENAPLHHLSRAIAEFVVRYAEKRSVTDLMKDYNADTIEGLPEIIIEAIEGGMSIYTLHVHGSARVAKAVPFPTNWKDINTLDLIISRL